MNNNLNLSNEKLLAIIKEEEIIFSASVKMKTLNKLIHKIRQIILIITNKSIYNIIDIKIERTLKFENITGVTISNSSDEFIIHAINDEYDCLYITPERRKIISILQNVFKAAKGKDLFFCKKDSKDLDKFVVKKRKDVNNLYFPKLKILSLFLLQIIWALIVMYPFQIKIYFQANPQKMRKQRTKIIQF